MDFLVSPFLVHKAALLSDILLIAFALSCFARVHWIADLFTTFTLQYCIGGFVLGMYLTKVDAYYLSLGQQAPAANLLTQGILCAIVFMLCSFKVLRSFRRKPPAKGSKIITIAHYNHLRTNKKTAALVKWLRDNANTFDIVSLHEITYDTFEALNAVSDLYPYKFPDARHKDSEIVLLSRHPIASCDMVTLQHKLPTMPGMCMVVKTPHGDVTMYGSHSQTPITGKLHAQRNAELLEMAKIVGNDNSQNIVFLGDWNITPFSPYFRDIVKFSKLHNLYTNGWPPLTWPAYLLLPFLKIPIDHILFSKNMKLADLRTGPTLGSDHHALVACFVLD